MYSKKQQSELTVITRANELWLLYLHGNAEIS